MSRATAMASWSARVDLPIPGSPPTSTTEPGTRPPPSTRSSSARPLASRGAPTASTRPSGTALPAPGVGSRPSRSPTPADAAPGEAVASSTSESQLPQPGQRPSQRGCCAPHSVQAYTRRAFATPEV